MKKTKINKLCKPNGDINLRNQDKYKFERNQSKFLSEMYTILVY